MCRWLRLSMGLVFAVGVARAEPPQPDPGAALLAPFKRELQAALREGLAAGPVEAISTCQLRAPEIARAASQDGIRVGRTSHRLRNPTNAAPEWVAPILEAYLADSADRAPRTVALERDRRGYAEPIPLQPVCLTCHGEALAPEVAARIDALYPADSARGFRVGELRGVFWIEYPSESKQSQNRGDGED